jgi:hypothetical protein
MATLHQVSTAKDGESFTAIGVVVVHKQFNPKISKNGKLFSSVILKSAGTEVFMTVWDDAAKVKLPLNTDITLRGKFTKNQYNGAASLKCEELVVPEGSAEWKPEEIQNAAETPKMKDCIDAGIRAADYMVRKERPDLAPAAFTFAANAFMQGIRME